MVVRWCLAEKHPVPCTATRLMLGRASNRKKPASITTMSVLSKFHKGGTGNYVEGVVNGRVGSGPTRSTSHETPQDTLKIASWNVGTMRGRSSEVVETITRRNIDLCCVQEVRWRGASARYLTGKDSRYKFFWVGNDQGTSGVGILLAEKWVEKVYDIKRVSDRIMLIKLLIGESIVTVLSVYAPQTGLDESAKDAFYDSLQTVISTIPDKEIVIPCGDWNGHVGKAADGYEGIHGGSGYGERNPDGDRILDFAVANDLIIANTCFAKRDSHLITYQSGNAKTQIDYVLLRKKHQKMVKDMKVIPSEECVPQHKLLVCDLRIKIPKIVPKPFTPKLRYWKLIEPEIKEEFEKVFTSKTANIPDDAETEAIWGNFKSAILGATEETCGETKKRNRNRVTWWWDDQVSVAIAEKRKKWKAWKEGGSKEEYLKAKRSAKKAVYTAKKAAEDEKFANLKPGMKEIFKMAKQMKRDNQDVTGEKCIKDDSGNLSIDDAAKKRAWKQHYERLLNEEFPWNPDELHADPIEGPPITISIEMVKKAIAKMKSGKAPGPSGIVAEMLKAAGDAGAQLIAHLANSMIRNGDAPGDWEKSFIINIYKGKGDALERGNYRGLKLLDHVMKGMERVIETIIRERVVIDGMQFGFMPGRGTTDAIFILRQIQEKHLAKHKKLYFAFVDLEKAFDRVPRRVIWWAMRKLGLEEWIVRFVQAMYTNTKSNVRVNNEYSEEFGVKVGVHQGSVLSPLLFIIVLEALSLEFRTGAPWELLYADDLVVIAETEEELRAKLSKWKKGMEAKGLRVNVGKTKVMFSGHGLHSLTDSGKHPCGVCRQGVGRNSIFCNGCSLWIHKRCTEITGPLKANDDFKCNRCLGKARPIDGRPQKSWKLSPEEELEVVDCFCYLGDIIGAGGGCNLSVVKRVRCAWGKFRELLPLLTSRGLSFATRGRIYTTYVRSVLLYASECWAPTINDLQKLQRSDRSMVRWICGVKLEDRVSSVSLLSKLGIVDLETLLRYNRLRWYGHVSRSDDMINGVTELVVKGQCPRGRPKKTWRDFVNDDCKYWKLTSDTGDRESWRSELRANMNPCNPRQGENST